MAANYDSPGRRAQALATRQRVLRSAEHLFTAGGYNGTSIASVAVHAGVSDRLVYNMFGSKRGLLFALLEHFAPAPREVFEAELAQAPDPAAQLVVAVDFVIEYFAAAAAFLAIALPAAAADGDLRAFVDQGEAFRRLAQQPVVQEWARRDALRAWVSPDHAADVLWVMTSPEVYLKLLAAGWAQERIRDWLIRTLTDTLLRGAHDS